MTGVAAGRGNALERIFGKRRVVIGVVHCLPLPGAPAYAGETTEAVVRRALDDAEAYAGGGVDGLIVENHGDIPFLKPDEIGPETVAMMAVVADRVRRQVPLPLGINVLANAAIPALSVAKAAGAAFIRVNQWANAYVANEGLVEGEAARALRHRAMLHARDVAIFADVHVKHGAHAIVADRGIDELARDVEFFDADVAIATGQRTGDAAALQEATAIRQATGLPLVIGSGVTSDNVADLLQIADGVIIGSALKHDGVWWNAVDKARVGRFMKVVGALDS